MGKQWKQCQALSFWAPKSLQMVIAAKKLLLFFILLYFTLRYCIGFAIHQHESAAGVHVFPILNPPPTIPLGHPSAPAPSVLYHASNLDRRLVSIKNVLFWWSRG